MQSGSVRLRSEEAAGYVGLSPSTLSKLRMSGDGPVFIKAGRRKVIYDTSDLDEWLRSRRRRSTSSVHSSDK